MAGPVVLDVYDSLLLVGRDHIVDRLIDEAELAARVLEGWNDQQVFELRSAAWRSAHRYVVDNVHLVDRGPELSELAKLLGVDRK